MKKRVIIAVLALSCSFCHTFAQRPGPGSQLPPGCQEGGDGGGVIMPPEIHVPGSYSSIQQAIDAADSGTIIHIQPGDYYEQLIISNKSITLSGEPGTILHATDSMSSTLS